ncbi:hypothetical protein HHI36_023523 [Cryptolaemus montrouzieri]|uniref:Transmembrane protein n=1 Tax=Cryptolaemus montrouzieri TaxID=559131 RepID=A0ABD2PGP8_9CUCU
MNYCFIREFFFTSVIFAFLMVLYLIMKMVASRKYSVDGGERVLDYESVNHQLNGVNGTMFRLHFLGSVEVDEEGGRKRRKRLKKNMVEVAVTKIKVCRSRKFVY